MSYLKEEVTYQTVIGNIHGISGGDFIYNLEDKNGKGYITLSYKGVCISRHDYDESGLPEDYRNGVESLFKSAVNSLLLRGVISMYEYNLEIQKKTEK
ncbi:MAG: hypothetical protein ABI091_26690 [Ferruginibacter sp.]